MSKGQKCVINQNLLQTNIKLIKGIKNKLKLGQKLLRNKTKLINQSIDFSCIKQVWKSPLKVTLWSYESGLGSHSGCRGRA